MGREDRGGEKDKVQTMHTSNMYIDMLSEHSSPFSFGGFRVNTIRSSKQPAYEYPEPLPPSPSSTPFAIAPNTPDFVEMVEEHVSLSLPM